MALPSVTAYPRRMGLHLVSLLKHRVLRPCAGRLLASPATSGLRMWAGCMRAAGVLQIVRRLDVEGVDVWVGGGWGVDALVGRQTRRHTDLDLVLDCAHEQRALAELAALGYRTMTTERFPGMVFPLRIVLYDAMGRSVDLHPVELSQWLVTVVAQRLPEASDAAAAAFADGRIDGRSVPCLSPALQLAAHEGYDRRDADRHDVRLLEGLSPAARG